MRSEAAEPASSASIAQNLGIHKEGPMTRSKAEILAVIEEFGWMVVAVPEDDQGPGFAYSIGLHGSFNHAEVIVFGLSLDATRGIVNAVGEEIRRGLRFGDGDRSGEIVEGFPVEFRAVAPEFHDEYFGQALKVYGETFAALQCVWPDRHGTFPGQGGCREECERAQPSLQVDRP